MIFQSETCLYVISMPKHQIHEKKFLIFSEWRIFSTSLHFSVKTAFFKTSADFVTGLQKLFFHLKALQTRMQIDVYNFFVVQVVPEIYSKNTYFKNMQMCIFVTDCRSKKEIENTELAKSGFQFETYFGLKGSLFTSSKGRLQNMTDRVISICFHNAQDQKPRFV